MARADREIDKTHLSIDQAEKRGFIHRDYIAHCLRWTYVANWLMAKKRYQTARILDVGCGREVPLAKLLHSSRMAPTEGYYLGVDYNKLEMPDQFANTSWRPRLVGGIDASKPADLHRAAAELPLKEFPTRNPTLVVSFEVLEHVTPAKCRAILKNFKDLADLGSDVIVSTPCWDPKVGAADNHINEMTHHALGALLEDMGFYIEGVFGTFASQRDLKTVMNPNGPAAAIFERLSGYYDSNYLSTIFAPLFPEQSRNCLWHLKSAKTAGFVGGKLGSGDRRYSPLSKVDGPWSQHPDWKQLGG